MPKPTSIAQKEATARYEAKHKRFSVRFTFELYDRLSVQATKRKTTVHALILDILNEWLNKQ